MEISTDVEQRVIDEQALHDALEALRPRGLDQKKRAFEKAYPQILRKLSEGINEGAILKVLADQGILKSRNTYVKWMAEMKGRQAPVTDTSMLHDAMQRVPARP